MLKCNRLAQMKYNFFLTVCGFRMLLFKDSFKCVASDCKPVSFVSKSRYFNILASKRVNLNDVRSFFLTEGNLCN